MNRMKWNYLIDVVLFALMGAVAFIGILLGFFTAEGPVADQGRKYVWGLHRHQWGDIHLWLSIALVVFVILHVLLHWSWIKSCTRKLLRSAAVLVAILVLPALLIGAAWLLSDEDASYQGYGARTGPRGSHSERPEAQAHETEVAHGSKDPKQVEIHGRMSLAEVEKETGVSAQAILDELGLPAGAPLDSRLGRLRREHGFSMDKLRAVISSLSKGTVLAVDSDGHAEGAHESAPAEGPGQRSGDTRHSDQVGRGQGQGLGRGKGPGQGLHQQAISGRSSLAEVERLTGVSARALAERLGLPEDAPLDEHLGQLRKRYGFSMQDVRAAVAVLKKSAAR
ncbi:MAG: DUF4405 domain-containing protein [Deltaproteobacteria bacterium]|nr:DUF4405 domain-containing protein [Deltaproteobacteria bacterium]